MRPVFAIGPAGFVPALIVFDKDGTLIDFEAMWGGWVEELARRLEAATGRRLSDRLFQALGFDAVSGEVLPEGRLAVMPMAELHVFIIGWLVATIGMPQEVAAVALAEAWYAPDPVHLARPVTDLAQLFGALRKLDLKIAIATTDDRAPTETTLAALGLRAYVDGLTCGDDGIKVKPAPDMVLALCRSLDVKPCRTVVVGDTVADLRMGRSAGVALTVGVLTGAGTAEMLAPYADVLLPSIAGLVRSV